MAVGSVRTHLVSERIWLNFIVRNCPVQGKRFKSCKYNFEVLAYIVLCGRARPIYDASRVLEQLGSRQFT